MQAPTKHMGLRKRAPKCIEFLLLFCSMVRAIVWGDHLEDWLDAKLGRHKSSHTTTPSFITADPDFAPPRDANSATSADNSSEDDEQHDAPTLMTNTTAWVPCASRCICRRVTCDAWITSTFSSRLVLCMVCHRKHWSWTKHCTMY